METYRRPQTRIPGKRALIADDNGTIRKMLACAFLSNGFNSCNEAENGKQAIEVAERVRPDVIVLDLSMPVMNGLDAAPKLRELFPSAPIILFTSYEDSLSKSDASKAGISLVLPKSMPFNTLIDKARELLDD